MNFLLFLLDFWLDYQVDIWASVHHSGSISMVYRGYKWPLICVIFYSLLIQTSHLTFSSTQTNISYHLPNLSSIIINSTESIHQTAVHHKTPPVTQKAPFLKADLAPLIHTVFLHASNIPQVPPPFPEHPPHASASSDMVPSLHSQPPS